MKSFISRCIASLWKMMSLLTLSIPLVFVLAVYSGGVVAGPVGTASGFEDDDGDLDPYPPGLNFDWNSFAPATWDEGEAPYRSADELVSGWSLTALEDDEANNSDSAFSGGTKQDDECAMVKGAKAPNKDDLKRVFVSSNTVGGDVFLNLAWVRIPQNTTSPSAHIGFEFNQSESPCPDGSDGLVMRTAGDMLIVYDFEGGAPDTPTISLRRWLTDPTDPDQADFFTDMSDPCEVNSSSPPCWGDSVNLTELGFAEALVNTSLVGPVDDDLAPPSPPAEASVTEMLQLNEFGEAGINLTAAGVFDQNVCLGFGKAFAVSRSSGNSAKAQMKDLVGPGDINIANCGRVIIRKVTDPSPDTSDTSFDYTTIGGLDPSSFSLKNGEYKDYGSNVFAGAYSVTESAATGWDFTSLDCSASTTTNGTSINKTGATVSFDLKPLDTVDCTYTNTARGDITVTKQVVNACTGPEFDGGSFTLFIDSSTKTGGHGTSLFEDDLGPGAHSVGENDPGDAYSYEYGGDADCVDGSVDLGAGESVSCTVTNIRLPHIKVNKVVTGGSSAEFDLLIDGVVYKSGVSGWVAGDGDNAGNGDSVEARVSVGSHMIKELQSDGSTEVDTSQWLVNISCTDGQSLQGSTSVNVSPLSGELVECTITNIPVAGAVACVEPNGL